MWPLSPASPAGSLSFSTRLVSVFDGDTRLRHDHKLTFAQLFSDRNRIVVRHVGSSLTITAERPANAGAQSKHLKRLEAESINIIREAVAEFRNPVMLYSIGKDSSVMVHLARRAFFPGKPPSRCCTSIPGGSSAR